MPNSPLSFQATSPFYRAQMSLKREDFMKFWRVSLRGLLGWSDDQVSDWAKQFEQDLKDLEYEFVRQDPISYIIPMIIPAEMQKRMSPGKLGQLYLDIYMAITGDPTMAMSKDLPDDELPPANWCRELRDKISLGKQRGEILGSDNLDYFNWDAARKRVQHVLDEAGLDPNDPPRWRLGDPGKEQGHYIKYWKAILKKLLEWSDIQVLEWVKQFENDMGDVYGEFYREEPAYYVVGLFVPPEAYHCLSPKDLRKLQWKIQFAITRNPKTVEFEPPRGGWEAEGSMEIFEAVRLAQERGELLHPANFHYYDWDAAKERIRAVLKEYGLQEVT
jgi:hypothetical protein